MAKRKSDDSNEMKKQDHQYEAERIRKTEAAYDQAWQ